MILRTGKASVRVLDRSVKKRLSDAALGDRTFSRYTCDPITLCTRDEDAGYLAVIEAANGLLSRCIDPKEVQTVILLPSGTEEEKLRRIEEGVREAAKVTRMQVTGGHTEVTGAVIRPVVTAAAAGIPWEEVKSPGEPAGFTAGRSFTRKEGSLGKCFGRDIVISGWISLEATYLLASMKRNALLERFPLSIISSAEKMREYLYCGPAVTAYRAYMAGKKEAAFMINASEGGIFAALWKLSERTGRGFDTALLKIPVLQESVEIAEVFGVNPYQMESAGCMIHLARDGKELVSYFEERGIRAEYIGTVTDTADKCIRNGEEKRSLDLPAADPLIEILG